MEGINRIHNDRIIISSSRKDNNTIQKNKVGLGKIIKRTLNKINKLEKNADQSIVDFLEGRSTIHETMIALQKADISMRLFLSFRNKAIEAYKEIMRMQF